MDPQSLPVPNQPPQSFGVAPTVVASVSPNPPAPQQAFTAWPNQPAPQRHAGVWSNQPAPKPQQGQGALGDWADLRVPQPWSSMPDTVDPALKPKRKGRGVIAWTLSVFAGGLFVGPLVADYADQGVEAGMAWLASLAPSAPGFVRPYLPKPLEAPAAVRAPVVPAAVVPVAPAAVAPAVRAEVTAQPARKPEITLQPVEVKAAVPGPRPVAAERPSKDARRHAARGSHGKDAVALASADEAPAPVAEKPTEPKHTPNGDPFDSHEGAGAPAAVKSQPAKSHDSLDDLMADGPGAGKAHDKRNTSREIDSMLKDVQKSDPAPAAKRAEPASAPSLTAADIGRVMSGVKSNAAECGKRFGESGVADLKLTVGKDGTLSNVAIRGKLADSPAGRCVVQAARNAVFPHNSGLTFDYRIDVR